MNQGVKQVRTKLTGGLSVYESAAQLCSINDDAAVQKHSITESSHSVKEITRKLQDPKQLMSMSDKELKEIEEFLEDKKYLPGVNGLKCQLLYSRIQGFRDILNNRDQYGDDSEIENILRG